MQNFGDLRSTQDCAFYVRGTCNKGSQCPFRHDTAAITQMRQQQSTQDCLYFLSGRCSKGSLCAFRHDEAKLLASLAALKAKLAASQGGLPSSLAAPAAAPAEAAKASAWPAAQPQQQQQQQQLVVDFGSRQAMAKPAEPPQLRGALPQTRMQQAPLVARGRAEEPSSGAAISPTGRGTVLATARRQPAPAEPRDSGPGRAAAPADFPSRLAGRLGPPSTAARADGGGATVASLIRRNQEVEKRPAKESGGAEVRQVRRRVADGAGLAAAVFQDVLGAEEATDHAAPAAEQAPKVLQRLGPAVSEASQRKRRAVGDISPPRQQQQQQAPAPKRTVVVQKPSAPRLRTEPEPAPRILKAAVPESAKEPAEVPKAAAAEFRPPKSIAEIRKGRQKQQTSTKDPTSAPSVASQAAARKAAPAASKARAAANMEVEQPAEEVIDEEEYAGLDDAGDLGDVDDFEAQMRALEDAL